MDQVKFGPDQIKNKTPERATWTFRIFFYLTSTVSLYLTVFTSIPLPLKLQISQNIVFANLAVHALSKMVGVEDQAKDYYSK